MLKSPLISGVGGGRFKWHPPLHPGLGPTIDKRAIPLLIELVVRILSTWSSIHGLLRVLDSHWTSGFFVIVVGRYEGPNGFNNSAMTMGVRATRPQYAHTTHLHNILMISSQMRKCIVESSNLKPRFNFPKKCFHRWRIFSKYFGKMVPTFTRHVVYFSDYYLPKTWDYHENQAFFFDCFRVELTAFRAKSVS